jgi:hypothetical protein
MYDIAYLRKLAERYRKLARKFHHANIRERLEVLADDLEEQVHDLQRSMPNATGFHRYEKINLN